MRKTVILFGTGDGGKGAHHFFGAENVLCFTCNNEARFGTKFLDKDVIDPDTLPEYAKDCEVIIAIAANKQMIFSIAMQLKKLGIENFSIYSDIRKYYDTGEAFLNRDRVKSPVEQETLWEIERDQLDYLIRHTDRQQMKMYGRLLEEMKQRYAPAKLLPATGKMRRYQRLAVARTYELTRRIERETGARPFLTAGTLLGAVRHGGFVPWDGDMDFSLICTDYRRLLDYFDRCGDFCVCYPCLDNGLLVYRRADGRPVRDCTEPYLARVNAGYIAIYNNGACEDPFSENEKLFDVSPMYFFPDDMTDAAYTRKAKEYVRMRKELGLVEGMMQAMKRMDEELKDTSQYPGKSRKVGYGFDYHSEVARGRNYAPEFVKTVFLWDYADCFPVSEIEFEGYRFYAPRDPDKWLKMDYGANYMSYPNGLGGVQEYGFVFGE